MTECPDCRKQNCESGIGRSTGVVADATFVLRMTAAAAEPIMPLDLDALDHNGREAEQ